MITRLKGRGEQHEPTLLAVATAAGLELDIPLPALNDPAAVAAFIERHFHLAASVEPVVRGERGHQ